MSVSVSVGVGVGVGRGAGVGVGSIGSKPLFGVAPGVLTVEMCDQFGQHAGVARISCPGTSCARVGDAR